MCRLSGHKAALTFITASLCAQRKSDLKRQACKFDVGISQSLQVNPDLIFSTCECVLDLGPLGQKVYICRFIYTGNLL